MRPGERGAETLELVAGLPLLGVVVTALLQGAALVEDRARAASDARELVRHAVVCEHRAAAPAAVAGDPARPRPGSPSPPPPTRPAGCW